MSDGIFSQNMNNSLVALRKNIAIEKTVDNHALVTVRNLLIGFEKDKTSLSGDDIRLLYTYVLKAIQSACIMSAMDSHIVEVLSTIDN